MKKFFTLLLIASGFCTASYAQYYGQNYGQTFVPKTPSPEFGIDVGYNGALVFQPYGNVYYGSASINGLNAGISFDIPFSHVFGLKIKAIYDQKGWTDGYVIDDQGKLHNGVDFRLHYITVPVLANFYLGRTWYMGFGPYAGYLFGANALSGANLKSLFNTWDGGFAFNLGIRFPVSQAAKLFFEYDSQAGFANIVKDDQSNSLVNFRYSFNVGLSFPFR
jgi:hypothetical protein